MKIIDFEVFKHDWLCVIMDSVTLEKVIIVNDKNALEKFHEEHKEEVFVGYNIRGYDQWIFKAILCDFNPKEVSDFIIEQGNHGATFSNLFRKIPLFFYDAKTTVESLKTLEGYMGSDICESSVPFDIDRALTADEINEVIKYCVHDVEETYKVFLIRSEEFISKVELAKMFDLDTSALSLTNSQLCARILNASKMDYSAIPRMEFAFKLPNFINIERYQNVVDWYKNVIYEAEPYRHSFKTTIAGVEHTLGWGGIHGARTCYHDTGVFVNVDVASYYPSMIVRHRFMSCAAKSPQLYAESYYSRLEYKAKKDPRQKPLKLFLNCGYGSMKDKYNALYDPLMANYICVTGQLLLVYLIEQVENSGCAAVVQSNTDGVLFKLLGEDEAKINENFAILDDVCYDWEQLTKMSLEFEEFTEVWQRDVNNYLLKRSDGSYKAKGGCLKKLHPLDNDLPIVNKALVEYMTKGTPIAETVNACDELIMFQKIYKVSNKYGCALHNGKIRQEKTFRVFASTDENDTALYKVRECKSSKFADCPEHCFIDNTSMHDKLVPSKLDKNYYIDLANRRLKTFIG